VTSFSSARLGVLFRQRAQLTDDLRHAHASLWLMAGGSLADVQRNLGHSTPVLTSETYGHIGEDHRIREVDLRLAGVAASSESVELAIRPWRRAGR